jgi:hypothetical protein
MKYLEKHRHASKTGNTFACTQKKLQDDQDNQDGPSVTKTVGNVEFKQRRRGTPIQHRGAEAQREELNIELKIIICFF